MKKLGEIATFSKGKGISKSEIEENGITECIRYGELYTHYREVINEIKSRTNVDKSALVLSEENDVIIPASGETTIDIATASCVLKPGIALGGDLNIIKSKNDGVFLSYYLNSKKKMEIANLAQGISVVHLYSSQLASLSLSLPTNQEQEKISTFLAKISERIDCSIKILIHLKSLIESLNDSLSKQKIRINSNFENCKKVRLGDLGYTFTGLSGKTKEDFGNGKRYIQYKQIFDSSKILIENCGYVNVSENENQNSVKYGDIFFTISSETPDEIGMSSVLLEDVKNVYLNSFCFGFRLNSFKELLPEFARFLFRSKVVRNEIKKLAQGSTRYNMSKTELLKLEILLPSIKEQKEISTFLGSLYQKIQTEKAILEQLEIQKKYLLQQMFV